MLRNILAFLALEGFCSVGIPATHAEQPILFNELPAYTTGPYARPANLVVADFTGDHVLDAVCDASMLRWEAPPFFQWSFLEGRVPTATDTRLFRDYVTYEADAGPQALITGDFDCDGLIDVAGCGVAYSIVTILYNTGVDSPRFSPPYQFGIPTGGHVLRNLIALNLTSDMVPDIVAVDEGGSVYVLRGALTGGEYSLQLIQTAHVSGWAFGLGVSDVDMNGHNDLLVFSNDDTSGYVSVFRASGSDAEPLLTPTTRLTAGSVVIQSAMGDLNGDGLSDFVVADLRGPGQAQIFTANGTTEGFPYSLACELATSGDIYALRIADMNADGLADVLAFGTEWCSVYLGQSTIDPGTVAFAASEPLEMYGECNTPAVVDVNVDGSLDIVLNLPQRNAVATLLGEPGTPGSFVSYPRQATVSFPERIYATDFDRDGRPDIVVAGTGYDGLMPGQNYGLSVYRHTGRGLEDNPYEETFRLMDFRPRAVTDFNNDGIADVLDLYLDCCLGNGIDGVGDGTYTRIINGLGRTAGSVSAHDFNGDGIVDVVKTYRGGGSLGVVIGLFYGENVGGRGTGRFMPGPWYEMGWDMFTSIQMCDLNDDGLIDVLVYVQNPGEDNTGMMGFLINDSASPGTFSRREFWTLPFDIGGMIVSEGTAPGRHDVWLSHMRYGQIPWPARGGRVDSKGGLNANREEYAEFGRLTIWKDFALVEGGGYTMGAVEERDYPLPFQDFGLADLDNDSRGEFYYFSGMEGVEQLQGTAPTWSGNFIGGGGGRVNAFADADDDGDLDIIGGSAFFPHGAFLHFYRNDTASGSTPVVLRQFSARRQGDGARISWLVGGVSGTPSFEVWRQNGRGDRFLVGVVEACPAGECEIVDGAAPIAETAYWLRVVTGGGSGGEWYGPAILVASIPAVLVQPCAVPNPFNPRTTIRFELPRAGQVKLAIYDQRGRRVRALVDGYMDAGYKSAEWDGLAANGSALPSGVYFARLETEAGVRTTKLTLAK